MKLVQDTPLGVGWVVWSVQPPRPSLTVIVKATFTIVDGGKCTLAPVQERCTGDLHHEGDLQQSVRYASDFAVRKKRGECLLTGTCHPPGGAPTGVSAVAFGIGRVKKSLAVYGDRVWSTKLIGRAMGEPTPFRQMPLRWERSFGGPEHAANPVGRGVADVPSADGALRPLPNIEDPSALISSPRDRPAPAGAFPIPPTWSSRMRSAGTYDARWQRTRWPWLPEDFDYAYFNAAPADQQIDGFWKGNEEITLVNLRPERARITTRLPGIAPRVFVELAAQSASGTEGAEERFDELRLQLDTITVDADSLRVLCVWRGLTEVASEKLDDVRHLFVTQEDIDGTRSPRPEMRERMAALLAAEQAVRAPAAVGSSSGAHHEHDALPPEGWPRIPTDEELEREPSELAPARARLLAMGIDPDVHAAAATPPLPTTSLAEIREELRKRFAQAELDFPPELERLGTDGPTPAEDAARAQAGVPAPARSATDLREHVRESVAAGRSLAGEDLNGADLHALDLGGAQLQRAILDGANLRDARLDRAALEGAVLAGADARGASFRDAGLRAADLTGITADGVTFDGAMLDGASLSGAHLSKATFDGASCVGAHLERTSCAGASFRSARLDKADLTGADLEGARFAEASLVDATLHGARATGVVMEGADLRKLRASEGASFRGAVFRGCAAAASRWGRADLGRADFSKSDLERADFTGADLGAARLDECGLRSACFREATMRGVSMLRADAFEACFEAADLEGADMRGSSLFGAQLWRARTAGARLERADVERTLLAGSRG